MGVDQNFSYPNTQQFLKPDENQWQATNFDQTFWFIVGKWSESRT
jgi:hypothetical protein